MAYKPECTCPNADDKTDCLICGVCRVDIYSSWESIEPINDYDIDYAHHAWNDNDLSDELTNDFMDTYDENILFDSKNFCWYCDRHKVNHSETEKRTCFTKLMSVFPGFVEAASKEEPSPKCICFNAAQKKLCVACGVTRETLDDEWEFVDPDSVIGTANEMAKRRRKNKNQKQKQQLPWTSTAPSKPKIKTTTRKDWNEWDSWGGFGKDRHDATPVTIHGITFYASSSNFGHRKETDKFIPDWGLYFDWSWRPWWRAEHIDWKDYSIPTNFTIAFEQILTAIEHAQAGKKVEMGCIGGHGRTGTALAAIAVILGSKADDAIDFIRAEYCQHAIETKEQEWWVSWVEAIVNNTTPPAKPAVVSTYNYAPAGTSNISGCTEREHFKMWLRGDPNCTKRDKCNWWQKDIESFDNASATGFSSSKAYLLGNKTLEALRTEAMAEKAAESKSNRKMQTVTHKEWDDEKKRYDYKVYHIPTPIKGEVVHQTTHPACLCDMCRYLRSGHGAFIQPYNNAKEWLETMDELDKLADSGSEPKPQTKLATIAGVHNIPVLFADGYVKYIDVADTIPKAPTEPGDIGDAINDYVYLDILGKHEWIWVKWLPLGKPIPDVKGYA